MSNLKKLESPLPKMSFNKKGKSIIPLRVFLPDGQMIIGVYQGSFSKFDILIKYKQKLKSGEWSKLRTPKHIHWAVDLLIKMNNRRDKIKRFLDFLIKIWDKTMGVKTKKEREKILNLNNLLNVHKREIKEYQDLSIHGEYSMKFLILLAKLLMIQEKTNMADAYMFRRLLEVLKRGEDIFSVVSIATHRGR